MRKEESAIITVYLSLILCIILSFIVTTIECARLNTGKTYLNRVLQTSTESSLCDYYLPLFENYHVFGYDLEEGTVEEHKEKIATQVMEKMNDSLEPEKRASLLSYVWNASNSSFLMCNPKLSNVMIDDLIYLSNDGGDYAKKQMIAYMKYQTPLDLLETALEAMGLIEDGEETSKVLQEKLVVESKMMSIDQNALELVELIDGIVTDDYGIELFTFTKAISCNEVFIKEIVTSKPTMQSVRINNSVIFRQLEDEYVQFPQVLDQLVEQAEGLMQVAVELGAIDIQKCTEEERIEYNKRMEEYEQNCSVARNIANYLTDTVKKMDEMIDKALDQINEIDSGRKELDEAYHTYLTKVEGLKNEISAEIFSELSGGSDDLERYSDMGNGNVSMIKDVNKMRQTLVSNQKLIKEILSMPMVPFSLEEEGFQNWLTVMNEWTSRLYNLSMEGLEFDYSSLNLDVNKIDVIDFVREMIGSYIADLVVGDNEISKEQLSGVQLPSEGYCYSENFPDIKQEDLCVSSILTGGLSFGNWGFQGIGTSIEDMIDDLLLNAYITEHMTNYTSEQFKVGQVLKYEQEYIITGEYEEEDSFYSVIIELLVLRILMNSISVIADSEKTSKAEATAAKAVGWVPVAGITQVVKYIILIYWAYCEAVVEVSALLNGKKVPIYTTKEDFKVEYSDLLSMNKEYVKKAVTNYECKSYLTLSYSQYLFLLMLFVSDINLVYRSLDLIQENLRYEYDENFRIKNCLFSYSCEAKGYMKQKFFKLPFIQQYDIFIDGYSITCQTAITY